MRRTLISTFIVLVLAGTVVAGESPDVLCGKAEGLIEEKPAEAGKLFGTALAKAQKKKDVLGIQTVADRVIDALGRVRGSDEAIVSLMGELDWKRSDACVSAHLLAGQLLRRATRTGDGKHVEVAAQVISRHARNRRAGLSAKTMAQYASGMKSIAAGQDDAGAVALTKALATATKEGWAELAMHVGTELAAAQLRLENEKAATAALTSVAESYETPGDYGLFCVWRDLVKARLPGAPEVVLAPYARAAAPYESGGSVSAAGGAGGAGRSPGPELAKVGVALPRFSAKTPLVTVERSAKGFLIRHGFDPSFQSERPFKSGVTHQGDGGVTLSFFGRGVALAFIDPPGTRGKPGDGSAPQGLRNFYPLAVGEVWGVTKEGLVTVSRRR